MHPESKVAPPSTDVSPVAAQQGSLDRMAGFGFIGVLIGSFVGFLLRPSSLIGQLPFTDVITKGANYKGLDELLKPIAQTSFNYMVAGAVVGVVVGVIVGRLIPSTPTTPAKNLYNRLIGVYFSPGEAFQEIGRAPRVLVPLLATIVLGALLGFLVVNRLNVQQIAGKQIEQAVASGQLTFEQANQQLEAMNSVPAAGFIKDNVIAIFMLQGFIIALVIAGVFKLMSMLLGTENEFKPILAVTFYASLAVSLISSLLMVILLYLKSPEEIDLQTLVGLNLQALLTMVVGKDGLPKFIMALARWVDLFAIWLIALLSIGYAAVSRRLKVSNVAMIIGGIYAVITLIGAVISAVRG